MAKKAGVIIPYKYRKLLEAIPREDRGDILMAALLYDETGDIPTFENPATNMLFMAMVMDFDYLKDSWNRRQEAQKSNGMKGGRPTEPNRTQANPNNPTEPKLTQITPLDIGIDIDIGNDIGKEKENIPFSLSRELNTNKERIGTRIDRAIGIWNDLHIKPPCRKTSLTIPQDRMRELIATFTSYSDHEIKEALENYSGIGCSTSHDLFPEYGSADGFLASGVEKYTSEADPWKRCEREKTADERWDERAREILEQEAQ